jgi:hypothetical protein
MKTNITPILKQYFESTRQQAMLNRINGNKEDLKIKTMTLYPEPFDQQTSIVFRLDEPSMISLVVYNPDFNCMNYLACGFRDKGYHRVVFDARELPAGNYIARLRTCKGIVKAYMRKNEGAEVIS